MSSTTSTDNTAIIPTSDESNTSNSHIESLAKEETFRVYVGNLNLKSTEDSIKDLFNGAGKVLELIIIRRKYKPFRNCFGFVGYSTLAEAEKAVETFDKKELDGRQLHVQIARPKVAKPKETTTTADTPKENGEEKTEEESTVAATITLEKKKKRKNNKKSRKPKTDQKQEDGDKENVDKPAEKKENSTEKDVKEEPGKENVDERNTNKDDSEEKEDKDESTPAIDPVSSVETSEEVPAEPKPKTTVFVANLPRKLKVDDLKEVFKEYEVESAIIAIQKNGRSKGYGFVELKTVDEMQRVLTEFVDFELEGRAIHVSAATSVKNTENKRVDKMYKKKPRRKSKQQSQPQQQEESEEKEEEEVATESGEEKPKKPRKFRRRPSNKKRASDLNEKETKDVDAAKEAQVAVKELKKEDGVEASEEDIEGVKELKKEEDVKAATDANKATE
ncbi:MAG: hypothetical protein EXX96DRAFT_591549 [Benjaminiella poitrasii]|nr:MAG: hypothetical protein EXX96DRAFT_591549 [Benjaminiella poitrasii]